MSEAPARHAPDSRRALRHPELLCVLAVLATYAVTLPLTLTEGDSAEWLVIARYGGIPHPSGYPLYAILLRAFALLAPPLPLVTALAALSSLCAAAAAWLTCRALRTLSVDTASAVVATCAIFLSSAVWRMANMPEPFALNLLLAAVVLALAARRYAAGDRASEATRGRDVFLLGLTFGFGLCNHHSLVWLVPLGLYVLWDRGVGLGRRALLFAGGFAAGLAPLTYLWWARTDASPYDYYPLHSLRDFWHLLLRVQYGTLELARQSQPSNWESVAYYFRSLPGWLSYGFALLVLVGLGALTRDIVRNRAARRTGLAAAWLASFSLASVVFFRMFNVRVESWIPSVIERFMALPTFLLVLPLAFGLQSVIRGGGQKRAPQLTAALALLLLGHVFIQSHRANRQGETFYEDHVRAVFAATSVAGDVLVTTSDAESLGAMDGRYILGLGAPDFMWLNAAHWRSRAFRRRAIRTLGLPAERATLGLTAFVASLLADRGRVAVTDLPLPPRPRLFDHAFVLGPLTVLVRAGDPLPSPDALWQLNRAFYGTQRLPQCPGCECLSAWDRALWAKYSRNVGELVTRFEEAGRADLADAAASLRRRVGECGSS